MTEVKPKSLLNYISESVAITVVISSLIASGLFTLNKFRQLLNDRLEVRHASQVLRSLVSIESALVNAQSEQRGYLITGDEPYLIRFQKSAADVDRALNELEKLVKLDPQPQKRFLELMSDAGEFLGELSAAADARTRSDENGQGRPLLVDSGSRSIDKLRATLEKMREPETQVLETRVAITQQSYRIGAISTFLTMILGLLLLCGVLYLIRYNRRRAARAAKILAAAALQRENYFRGMADASPAMIWITNTDHMCTFLSRRWYESTGQTEAEGMGLGWTSATHPEDHEFATNAFLGAARKHESFLCEYRLRMADGDYRWALDVGRPRFNDAGEFTGYIGNVIDVHERWLAENELRTSENRLRLAAESTGFGTYEFDVEGGMSIWSEQLYRLVGLPIGTAIDGETIASLVYPEDREMFQAHLEVALAGDQDKDYQAEFRIIRADGEVRWVIDSGRAIYEVSDSGHPQARVVGTIQDITERKNFEQSLQRARMTAEAANRSRGEFLANMSHEIRTPMAAILGHADILNDHLTDPDDCQVVETIRRNGKFLLDIINDILDLSKIDAGKLEIDNVSVRPDRLIAEVRSLMDVRAAEKNLPLKIEFDGPIPETLETDAVRLRQILINLIGNAIKFTDEGEVNVVVRYTDRLIVEVIDTGIGIRAEDQQNLFEPFIQADNTSTRSFGGTGLGLAICRRLAQALGGDVSVLSELGKGSVFTLSIQAAATGQLIHPDYQGDSDSEIAPIDIKLACTVLIVDDRRDIRYLAQHFIEKSGGKVVTATNGLEAVEFISDAASPNVDVILMDMQMPVMDGYEAVAQLRRQGCELPIIALTANAMKSDRDRCLAAGCTDYTCKPLDRRKVIGLIDAYTRSRLETNSRGQTRF